MQNNEPKIIVIVALYHPKRTELENVKRYIRACDVCICMDDSELNGEEIVNNFFKQNEITNYKYYWNMKNIGLCASVNRGISIACNMNAEWVLLMNGDSVIQESTIYEFKKFIKENNTSKIASIVPQYNYDRHPRVPYKGFKRVLWANMSGMCINCNCLDTIGLFDERLFIDGLDIDWGIRAQRAGYKLYEIGPAVMNHHPAETREFKVLGRTIFKYGWASPIRYYYQFRANHYMIKKYKSFEALKWQAIKLIKVILLFSDKAEYLRMFIKAIEDCNKGTWGKCK